MPLVEILTPLKLSDSLRDAVLHRGGELGQLLNAVEKTEQADTAGLTGLLDDMNLSATEHNQLTLESHQWMLGVIHDKQDRRNA